MDLWYGLVVLLGGSFEFCLNEMIIGSLVFLIFRNQRTMGFPLQFFEGKFSKSKNRQFQFRLLHKSLKKIALKIFISLGS
jgi:hypothetical protein